MTGHRPGAVAEPRSMVGIWNPLVHIFPWGLVGAFDTEWLTAG
jgi:hypothetical protein